MAATSETRCVIMANAKIAIVPSEYGPRLRFDAASMKSGRIMSSGSRSSFVPATSVLGSQRTPSLVYP